MKKTFATILSLVLAFSLCVTAFASDEVPASEFGIEEETVIKEGAETVPAEEPVLLGEEEEEQEVELKIIDIPSFKPKEWDFIKVKVTDKKTGETITDVVVKTDINGTTYTQAYRDEDGFTYVRLMFPYEGTYTIRVWFDRKGIKDEKSEITQEVTVPSVETSDGTTKIVAGNKTFKVKNTKKVKATLKNKSTNKPIKNAKLTLTVNKKTYTARTNKKGIATFTVKLKKKGTYKATIKYTGGKKNKGSKKTITIKVKK